LNFVINGQIYCVLKTFGGVRHTWEQYSAEIEALKGRIAREPCIEHAVVYGSLARDEWKPTSDLDVCLVRSPGLRGAWRVCAFALRERARAFRNGFPLDLFVLDTPASLDKKSEKASLVILGGSNHTSIFHPEH
jgi:predicted nucleotidyltransferase